jgi:hypothetical protein
MISLVTLGDFVSVYLALLNGVDPSQAGAVAEFKAALTGWSVARHANLHIVVCCVDRFRWTSINSSFEVAPTDASLQRKLRNWQMLLLDLTRANRLLYFKAERGSSVPITSPSSAELFQLLVTQGKPLKFPAADERALFEEEEHEPTERSAQNPVHVEPRDAAEVTQDAIETAAPAALAVMHTAPAPARR